MKQKSISRDFTEGKISSQLLRFTIPFMLSNALQVLYSTVDMVIVGHYVGTPGLSAVSQSSLIINFATMVCLGFANAGQVLVSQSIGAGKKKEMNDIIGTLFSMILILAVILSGVILGACYAMGAAAPLIFTGAVIIAKVPESVKKPAMALPYHLYMLLTQGTSSVNAYGTAFVMMMVVLVTNSLAIWFTRRNRK